MVYLLHFARRYGHAGHYTGFARDKKTFARRIEHHGKGSGARLMAVVVAAGIDFTVARTWEDGDRTFERKLKDRHGAARYCPLCRQAVDRRRDAKPRRKAA